MGIVKGCIILIALSLICALGFFCIRLANVLNHLQQLVYYPDSDYPLVADAAGAKNELRSFLETTCVIVMGCLFSIFCVIYVHISQWCMRTTRETRPCYNLHQFFTSVAGFVLIFLVGMLREKLNNLLTVSFDDILDDVELWNTDVNNNLCKLVTCTSCLIIVCIGCIIISQRPKGRVNN